MGRKPLDADRSSIVKIFNILKNLSKKVDDNYNKEMVTVSWGTSSSSALWTPLTQTATLSKGKWLGIILAPTSSNSFALRLNTPSGTTTLNNQWFGSMGTGETLSRIFEVTSATAQVVWVSAQTASVTFSNTDRGCAVFIKVGG